MRPTMMVRCPSEAGGENAVMIIETEGSRRSGDTSGPVILLGHIGEVLSMATIAALVENGYSYAIPGRC
jgi:hypothetical protein